MAKKASYKRSRSGSRKTSSRRYSRSRRRTNSGRSRTTGNRNQVVRIVVETPSTPVTVDDFAKAMQREVKAPGRSKY